MAESVVARASRQPGSAARLLCQRTTSGKSLTGSAMRSAAGTSAPTEKWQSSAARQGARSCLSSEASSTAAKRAKFCSPRAIKAGSGGPRPSTAFDAFCHPPCRITRRPNARLATPASARHPPGFANRQAEVRCWDASPPYKTRMAFDSRKDKTVIVKGRHFPVRIESDVPGRQLVATSKVESTAPHNRAQGSSSRPRYRVHVPSETYRVSCCELPGMRHVSARRIPNRPNTRPLRAATGQWGAHQCDSCACLPFVLTNRPLNPPTAPAAHKRSGQATGNCCPSPQHRAASSSRSRTRADPCRR